ncbi:hypothetical protein [Afifella sp. IM 167]|uniref:hypothetical protein n=1 Tax=Afifella sp. IM 167 TaxID=2033586 RepID=UPI001CCB6AFF|nr:hypothetical protein [Afifella sp. IM 167]MBZ8134541.1 hypothetical protein [Afifella sp. IM 167]
MKFSARIPFATFRRNSAGAISLALPLCAALVLGSCAGVSSAFHPMRTDPVPQEKPVDPEKAAARENAIAEIRAKSAAGEKEVTAFPHVFTNTPPSNVSTKSPERVEEITQELRAIAEARKNASGAQLAELAAREQELMKLMRTHDETTSEEIRQNSANMR